jgi:hypothetical protein
MAVLEIIMNVKDGGNGEQIALSSLKKVGEQVLTGAFSDPSDRLKINLDLNEIAALFNGDVVGKALKLYVMSDAENQLLTDRYSYEICPTVALNIEGTEFNDFSSHEYYMLTYSPYDNLLLISMHPEAFKGGQKSSGSVFLVSGDQYYELVMDILFGSEQDEKTHFDILATEQMGVKLMLTGDYYTYLNRQTGEYALVQPDRQVENRRVARNRESCALCRADAGRTAYLHMPLQCSPRTGILVCNRGSECI